MVSLGSLSFFAPWAFLGLFILPLVWWIVRLTPPRPQTVRFPAIRLLAQVTSKYQTSHSYPWWLLLFRLVMVSLLITGAAAPVYNHQSTIPSNGPFVVIVDDGWAAAPDWKARIDYLENLVVQADRQGRGILLLTTAEPLTPATPGIQSPSDALETLRGLRPKPWQTDGSRVLKALSHPDLSLGKAGQIIWLGDGLQSSDGQFSVLMERLTRLGPVTYVQPASGKEAKALFPPYGEAEALVVPVRRANSGKPDALSIVAYDEANRAVGQAVASFDEGDLLAEAKIELPIEIRNRIELIRIEGERSAGAVVLLDERWRRRPVGVVSDDSLGDDQPLLSGQYYLDRALQAVTDVRSGSIDELLDRETAVMVLVDPAPMRPNDHNDLVQWINRGGVLVIFAGPRIASLGPVSAQVKETGAASGLAIDSAFEDENKTTEVIQPSDSMAQLASLFPVTLRSGNRAIGGAMSWRRPASIAPFEDGSPFQGLIIPNDVRIQRQVLAEPSLDLDDLSWARLTDGTPLVTARPVGQGTVILFHVTANAEWSNLPLSGLFVDMLKRITEVSHGVRNDSSGAPDLMPPRRTLDGAGHLTPPAESTIPVRSNSFELTPPSPRHPPGFYGARDTQRALNLTAHLAPLQSVSGLPNSVSREVYGKSAEKSLAHWFFLAAGLLLGLDMIASLWLRGTRLFRLIPFRSATGILLTALLFGSPVEAVAQSEEEARIIAAANQTRIAYVYVGDSQTDTISRLGLASLGNIMAQRTSVELAPPDGIDPAINELAVYPLIYWPITETTPIPSALAARRINTYLANGGTILFDILAANGAGNPRHMRQFATVLDIPRLMPVPGDHILTRAFYLLQDFPGRWAGSPVWVVPAEERVNDGVSPIIAGGHHWTAAWATDSNRQPLFAAIPGGERQREYAYRFGINLVMYVLTGNYKGDQVHLPTIMNRLGQ